MEQMHYSLGAVAIAVCVAASCATAQTFEKVSVEVSSPQRQPQASPPQQQAQKPAPATQGSGTSLRLISNFDSAPFSFKEGIERKGFEIELAQAIGKELGRKIEWIEKGFNINTYASALDMGSADAAISSISITDERKEQLAFTRPYFRSSFAIATKKDVDWEHSWFTTGLKDWQVGVMRNTTGEQWSRDHLAADIKTYSSVDRLAQALKNAKLGPTRTGKGGFCILHDQAILKWALSDFSYHYEIVEKDITREYYGIAVSKNNKNLLADLNAALEKLREIGAYKKLYQKWYKEAEDLPMFQE